MKRAVALLGGTLLGLLALVGSARAADEVKIPFTQTKLENGLTVILHEDHALPLVVVNVSYKVGSRYEQPKRTGFAHLFEHLMFMGTRRVPTKAFDAWMEEAGGWNNAWTSSDRTDYYDVAPRGALSRLLWLEADRLRDLGSFMTKEKLDAQRDVVRNERRQRTENTPYGIADLKLPEMLYPEGHPYHHPVIGSHEDLEAASVDDVKEFFARWYDPANASLVIAGDFEPGPTLDRVRALFGTIPTRGAPKDPGAPGFSDAKSTMTAPVRATVQDRVELPKVIMTWQSPRHFGAGDADLDLLGAVLTKGKASRLYEALVYTTKLAQSVDAEQESGTLGSRFVIEVVARPGVSLDALEAAVDKELAKVRDAEVKPEELERARNGTLTAFALRLESVRERASLLNLYEAEVGDPGFVQKDLNRYLEVTPASIHAVAAKVLDPSLRAVLRIVPAPQERAGAPKEKTK